MVRTVGAGVVKRSERWRLITFAIALLAMACWLIGAATDGRWWGTAGAVLVLVSLLTGEVYRYWVWHQ